MGRYDDYAVTLTSSDGVEYASGLQFLDFLYTGRTVFHKVRQHEVSRPDIIAYEYFSDPQLYWIILTYNNLKDPISEVALGTTLAIPIDALSNSQIRPFTYIQDAK